MQKPTKLLVCCVLLACAWISSPVADADVNTITCLREPAYEDCKDCCTYMAEDNDCELVPPEDKPTCAAGVVQTWSACLGACDYKWNQPVCDGTTC